jgi:hypothetical protein
VIRFKLDLNFNSFKEPKMGVFKFSARTGMNKPSFHVIDRIEWYLPSIEDQVLIPSQDALLGGMVKVLNSTEASTEYWSKYPFIVVSVSQSGHKVPSYSTRFIIKLGGEQVIRINTFGKPGPLFFEADGDLMNVGEQFKRQLEFACLTNKTAPQSVAKTLVITKSKDFVPTEGRGIQILKTI